MLERLATRLGVEPVQLEYWRDAWTVAETEFATAVAGVLGFVLGGGAPVLERERPAVRDALWATPCDQTLRDQLTVRAMGPQTRDDATRELSGLARSRRIGALQRCVDAVRRSASPEDSRSRLVDVAWGASVPAESVDRWFR